MLLFNYQEFYNSIFHNYGNCLNKFSNEMKNFYNVKIVKFDEEINK